MFNNKKWTVSLTIVFIVLGLLLSLQFRTQKSLSGTLEAQKTSNLVAMWKNLNTKRSELQKEIGQLQQQLYTLQANSGTSNAEKSLEKELQRLQMFLGISPVKGPGISVTITGDAPLLYWDLVDLVNELWASGAEAISINEKRVSVSTAIADKEEGSGIHITVNGHKLLYPIVVKAIGDPHTLEKGLTFTGGLIENFNNAGIYPVIKKEESLELPAIPHPRWDYTTTYSPPKNPE